MKKNLILIACVIASLSVLACTFTAYAEEPITEMGFIDGHADTITTAMGKGQDMYANNLHVDFQRLAEFGAPVQVFSIWCNDSHVADAFEYAEAAIDFFMDELNKHSDMIELALTFDDIEENARNNKISAILAFEGGEPLMGKIENLEYFYDRGVRIITLTWNRENELGYGVGTGSDKGLKPFGIECVRRMNELGVIIDVSHLNDAGFRDVNEISVAPYMASHSNAYSVATHRRNLKDWQIEAMIDNNCIIGLNLYPYFLSGNEKADINDMLRHIEYFIDLGAEEILGLGCDFDGIEVVPEGFDDILSLNILNSAITDHFGKELSDAVFYKNYYEFLRREF